ncbi:MAG: DEAD/DEAH box helicase family protein [Campylobacterales bacterium]|nr:DEAD/DEAH box helicase family protein [Campylobacterales bacterium]
MELKNYQKLALETLKHFCKEYSRSGDKRQSYIDTKKEYGQNSLDYIDNESLSAPNVCIRIPTGGGKTLIATRSIPVITRDMLNIESGLILWLAHTNPIVEQTTKALKDSSHPYKKFLDETFNERTVRIYTVQEALHQSFDLSTELPIIIGTIQSFSTKNKDGRKFYEENGVYSEMLGDKDEPSLFKAIKKSHPIIIMDEAHNASTPMRVSSLVSLDPSFILELTATPNMNRDLANDQYASNIIYSVSASQLKAEDMIKLPVVLETSKNWEETIRDAVSKQKELETISRKEEGESGQFVNPIILFKAEKEFKDKKTITYQVVLDELMKTYGFDREEIAVHTSGIEDLNNVDLMRKDNKIKCVITVDKLKEGWDAPFVYILAIMGDVNSSTAIEQFLGRALRQPYATSKTNSELNSAYAFVNSTNTYDVAKSLKDSLVENGFEKFEANWNLIYKEQELGGLFETKPSIDIELDSEKIDDEVEEFFTYDEKAKKLTVVKEIPKEKQSKILSKLESIVKQDKPVELKGLFEEKKEIKNFNKKIQLSNLLIKQDGNNTLFDSSVLLEELDWQEEEIAKHFSLSESEFNLSFKKEGAVIDITSDRKINIKFVDEVKKDLLNLNGIPVKYNDIDITRMVLSKFSHGKFRSIGSKKIQKFVHGIVKSLIEDRGFDPLDLKVNIYYLTETIAKKIRNLEKELITKKYHSLLDDSDVWEVDSKSVFSFSDNEYPVSKIDDRGDYFKKHYYKVVDKLNDEEFEFAKYIDSLDEVEFWVRNIERNPQYAFWLQTSTDKFYPDFVIQLTNGKTIVAEYKGDHLRSSNDTKEKEKIGKVWAGLSEDTEFVMVFKDDFKTKVQGAI